MEKGTLRVDANVSVRPVGEEGLRTRTEIKNLNSFSYIARGIEAEIERQTAVWESGAEVEQATFDFDASSGELTSRRTKEEAEDYRYFPEPDLVPIEPPAELVARLRAELPELPGERVRRLEPALGFALAGDIVTSGRTALYESLLGDELDPREVANFLMNEGRELEEVPNPDELRSLLKARREIPRDRFLEGVATSTSATFTAVSFTKDRVVSDTSELEPLIDRVLAENPSQVEAYRGGKEGLLGFFVGQVMRETQGRADAKLVGELVRAKLG